MRITQQVFNYLAYCCQPSYAIYIKKYTCFQHLPHNKCIEAANRIIHNYMYVKYSSRNGYPLTYSIDQNTPNVASPLCMPVEQKHPLRLDFGLSLMGYFGGSISLGGMILQIQLAG